MKRRALLTALVAAAAFAATGGADAADSLKVTQAKAPFPQRSVVVSLPESRRIDATQVLVKENGEEVRGLTVLPADAAGSNRFGAVLVIDASNSMRGKPIASAMGAARAFAARLNPGQPLGIVAFNSTANVVLPFTGDLAKIEAALARAPKLGEGTHIYDAVVVAASMLRRAGINPATVVLLTDGRDTGSKASLDAAAQTAIQQRLRIFAIGMRSPVFDPQPLQELADAAGGGFTEAGSPESLAKIYDDLGARLSNEYLLTYRSRARLGSHVEVTVSISGVEGKGTASYSAPSLAEIAPPPFHRSSWDRFWQSPGAMLLVALFVSALVGSAVALMFRPPNRTLRRRLSEFVSLARPEPEEKKKQRRPQLSPDELLRRAEQPFEGVRGWTKFKEELEIAEVQMPALQIVLWTAIGTIVLMWLIATITGAAIFAIFGLAVPWTVRALLKRKLRKKRDAFSEQLPDNLQVLASALRSGHSLIGALSVVVEESAEPSRSEFQRVIADEQLGVPLEDALGVVVYRMDNKDLEQVALVAALQRKTGSSAAEVLDRVTETVRERFELRRLVKTLTAQGRLSRWIVSLLPPALMLVISAINPHYLDPLFHSSGGRLLLVLGTLMVCAGSWVIKKIVEIEV